MAATSPSKKYGSHRGIVIFAVLLDVALLVILLIHDSKTKQSSGFALYLGTGSWMIPLLGHLSAVRLKNDNERAAEFAALKRKYIQSLPSAQSYGWIVPPDSEELLGEFYMNRNLDRTWIVFRRVTFYEDEGLHVDVMSYGDEDSRMIETSWITSVRQVDAVTVPEGLKSIAASRARPRFQGQPALIGSLRIPPHNENFAITFVIFKSQTTQIREWIEAFEQYGVRVVQEQP